MAQDKTGEFIIEVDATRAGDIMDRFFDDCWITCMYIITKRPESTLLMIHIDTEKNYDDIKATPGVINLVKNVDVYTFSSCGTYYGLLMK